jgi:hypothetical protein
MLGLYVLLFGLQRDTFQSDLSVFVYYILNT